MKLLRCFVYWWITLVMRIGIARSLEFEDIISEGYDKMHPPKENDEATVVRFHVAVNGLDSINEYSMTYAADIFFCQTWKDHRLRLPDNMTSTFRVAEVNWLKRLWRPDSFFKNAKQVTFQTMTVPNHYLWLYKDQTILYMVKLTLTLTCVMNFVLYPHDTQQCRIQIESLSHTTNDLVFEWDEEDNVPLFVASSIELPQLQLVNNYTNDCTQHYSTGNFTCLEVVFHFRRRLTYFLFHTYIPTCLIVIMSWLSFWIRPDGAPARVTLGVNSILTLSTQQAKSQASLPPVSYLKIVDAFMSICTIFVFMALMEYCLVNVVLGDHEFVWAIRRARAPINQQDSPVIAAGDVTPAQLQVQLARNTAIKIDRYSRVLFPLCFFLINISYWVVFYFSSESYSD